MVITELLNKRVLISKKEGYGNPTVEEVKVLEVSPSGNWVKLMNINGNKYWRPVVNIALIETLIDLEVGKR